METCPPISKVRLCGAVLTALGGTTVAFFTWPLLVTIPLIVPQMLETPIFTVVFGALAMSPLLLCVALFVLAGTSQFLVGQRLMRGELRDVVWARDAAGFLGYSAVLAAVGTAAISLLLFAHSGRVAMLALPSLIGLYALTQQRVEAFLSGLTTAGNWWELTERMLNIEAFDGLDASRWE